MLRKCSPAWIMATSLPPSPTAAVIGFLSEVFIILTISDFCRGDILQHTTAEHFSATRKRSSLFSVTGMMRLREEPSTMRPYRSSIMLTWSAYPWSFLVMLTLVCPVTSSTVIPGCRWPQL